MRQTPRATKARRAAAGAELPTDRPIDGVDLLPLLTGATSTPPHPTLYWRMGRVAALRAGDCKLVIHRPDDRSRQSIELYDLAHDVGESHDLAEHCPAKARELLSRWEQINRQMVPPAWTPGG